MDIDGAVCVFCGYEPYDPDGIYSEVFEAYVCTDCEAIAVRVLTTVAESGGFRLGRQHFEVRPSRGEGPEVMSSPTLTL